MSESEKKHSPGRAMDFALAAGLLVELGRNFYHRGWVLGTSGNFSVVLDPSPLRLAITASGADKGSLTIDQVLQIDGRGNILEGRGRPSSEAMLHIAVVGVRGAGAVLHTHSIWSNIVSEAYAAGGGISIEGYEMLKGLEGVRTHEHREWLPIIENSQDYVALARSVEEMLCLHPDSHGFLLRRHGLYTWGSELAQAKRHVEILEFLLEVIGRTAGHRP
jgi:methylthioribulose-1-phosphate dehydratase